MYKQGSRINLFNENIKVLLDTQNLTLNALAAHLGYDVDVIEKQLNAEQTFPYSDLVKICSFLNQLPADFFYERVPDDIALIAAELAGDSRISILRFRETKLQIVSYFHRRVVYN